MCLHMFACELPHIHCVEVAPSSAKLLWSVACQFGTSRSSKKMVQSPNVEGPVIDSTLTSVATFSFWSVVECTHYAEISFYVNICVYIYISTYQKKIWNLSRMSITLREFFQPCCHLVSSCRRPRTSKLPSFHADHLLADSGWWFQPLWKIWTWTGMIIPNIWREKKKSQITNQYNWFEGKSTRIRGEVPPSLPSTKSRNRTSW